MTEGTAGIAPTAVKGADESSTHLLHERISLLAEQSTGAAASTALGAMLIGIVLHDQVAPLHIGLWIASYLGPAIWRIRLSRRIRSGARPPDAAALRQYLVIALFNGVWAGALAPIVFSQLSVEGRVALTVVVLLSLTAGAATFAPYRAGYLCVLALSMPPLIHEWATNAGPRSWIVVVTLAVFGGLMVLLSRHLANVFERSVQIRFEREQFVEQLKREKEETELARQRAEEASRAKSRFLANASHDLRQPAHALGLFTGVLEETAQSKQHRDIARHIAAASRMLSELLDNLLDISRLDAGTVKFAPQPVALRALVQRLCEDARRLAQGRPIDVGMTCDDLVVRLDPVLVERALRNLVDNALKFTTVGSVWLSAHARSGRLELSVKDSGCGIPPQQQALVFEEFYQVGNSERDHRKGLGLGLSIVSRLAALMQGSISLESQAGRGAVFTLRLPLTLDDSSAESPPASSPERFDLHGYSVLVVDDEEIVRAGMRDLLASWGAEVDEAEGLAQVRTLVGASHSPQWRLCLCDLRLRGGEDGIDTARQLRLAYPHMPIALITGDTAPQRIEQAEQSGFMLLHKPVAPTQLAQAMQRLLGGGHADTAVSAVC